MKIKQIISIFIITLMLTATLPITALAQSSVGSTSLETNIGEDVIQGQHTQYDEVEVNETQTQVYLTVEDSDLIVSLPTTVILSGIPDEQGKYIGKYSVGVAGDMSGDKIVNIEPESSTVEIKQKGKVNKTATVEQVQTSFTTDDFKNNTRTTGTVTGDKLTAGSWNGSFNFEITTVKVNRYYSSINLATQDINQETVNTDKTVADLETAENAVCGVYKLDDTYRIEVYKDVENQSSVNIKKNMQFNFNNHTVSFTNANNIVASADLTINNGRLEFRNTSRSISFFSDKNKFILNKVTMNTVSDDVSSEYMIGISCRASYNKITDSSISYNSKVANKQVINVKLGLNNTTVVKNSTFICRSTNAEATALQLSTDTALVDDCVLEAYTDANTHSSSIGLYTDTKNLTVKNSKVYASAPTEFIHRYSSEGIKVQSGTTNLYNSNVSVDGNSESYSCDAIVIEKEGTCNIYSGLYTANCNKYNGYDSSNHGILVYGKLNIEQQDGLVNVKGGNCAVGVHNTSAIVNINGGTYSSPNHGGLYNADCKSINIKNAIMYNSKTSGEEKDAPCVAYGGLYSSGAGNITITNSKILGGNHCIRIKNESSGSANVIVSNSYLEGQNDVLSLAAGTFTVGENVTLKSKTGRLLEANPSGTLVDPYNVFQLQ